MTSIANGTKTMERSAISPIVLRTITGSCHVSNTNTLDWSSGADLLAYGSNLLVIVVDPTTLQTVQVLDKHRSNVTKVAWTLTPTPKHPADRLTLASADAMGHIIVWNVKAGEIKAILHDGNKPVQEMSWLDGRVEGTGHLLAALHPPFSFILWDTSTGNKVWKKSYTEALQGFDFDPFDTSRVAFKCIESVFFIEDFHHSKVPSSPGKKFYVRSCSNNKSSFSSSPNHNKSESVATTPMAPAEDHKTKTRTKIKQIMKEIVSGEMLSGQVVDTLAMSECIQVTFHKAVKNHLLLVYQKEVIILDLDIGQTVGLIGLDVSSPSIVKVIPATQRDVLFVLTEYGSILVKRRKGLYEFVPSSVHASRNRYSAASIPNTPALTETSSADNLNFENVLEIVYEQKACSESIRLNKNAKILGMTCSPRTERTFVTLTSDGRLIFSDLLVADTNNNNNRSSVPSWELKDIVPSSISLLEAPQLKFNSRGILSGLAPPPFVVRMCPPLTMKNMNDYIPYLAIGSSSGDIQIVNVSTGKLEKEIATHTFPVRGLEWAGMNSILSHAHQNLTGSNSSSVLVRNELIFTDIRKGSSLNLRSQRSEEPPIDMLRVSHLKQYFIVAFAGAPFELWDLKNLSLLRTMPKKFPPITALDWSPLHNLKSLKKKMTEDKKNQDESAPANEKDGNLVAKEHFVFTDPEGQLYHFSVEGNVIRDGTKVPAETSLGVIKCIAWKSDHIVRGDSEGNLNVWDVRTRTSKNIGTNKGPIKKLRFAPGRGNFKILVLNPDFVSIWDVKECELINELRTPKEMTKIIDVDWAASDRAILVTVDGCLRIMGLGLSGSTSPMQECALDQPIACYPMLPNKARSNLEIFLHHQPWREKFDLHFSPDDGFQPADLEFVREQIKLLPEALKSELERDNLPLVKRCVLASTFLGLSWESEFWKVADYALCTSEESLDMKHDFLCDQDLFYQYHERRIAMHETRCGNDLPKKRNVIDKLICLSKTDDAVRLLLETEPGDPSFYEDSLKACLVSSTSSNAEDPQSTMKLVATNLIAEGKVWEGVSLLCQIDKVFEACSYLQSCGKWDDSMWLAKSRLSSDEYAKVAKKYCDHLMQRDLKKRAVLVLLSMKDYVSTLDALVSSKMIVLAAQFLDACQEKKVLPDTSHALVLVEEISLSYARYLFDCGNNKGAFFFCDKADEKGEILRREFEVLMAVPPTNSDFIGGNKVPQADVSEE